MLYIIFFYGYVGEVIVLVVFLLGCFIVFGESIFSGVVEIIFWEVCNEVVGTTYVVARRFFLYIGEVVVLVFSMDESVFVSIGGDNDCRVVMWNVFNGNVFCGFLVFLDGKVRTVAFLRYFSMYFLIVGELVVSVWEYDVMMK